MKLLLKELMDLHSRSRSRVFYGTGSFITVTVLTRVYLKIHSSQSPRVTNYILLPYSEEFILHPTSKLQDHLLSAVCDCLLEIYFN
jgi:hypothetical protein